MDDFVQTNNMRIDFVKRGFNIQFYLITVITGFKIFIVYYIKIFFEYKFSVSNVSIIRG